MSIRIIPKAYNMIPAEVSQISMNGEPGWVHLFDYGVYEHPNGDFVINEASASAIVNLHNGLVMEWGFSASADHDHESLFTKSMAHGSFTTFKDLGPGRMHGIWAWFEPNDRGKEMLKAGDVKFISPVVTDGWIAPAEEAGGKLLHFPGRIHSVALTNTPRNRENIAIAMAEKYGDGHTNTHQQQKEESQMDKLKALFLRLFKLNENATEDEMVTAFQSHWDESQKSKETVSTLTQQQESFAAAMSEHFGIKDLTPEKIETKALELKNPPGTVPASDYKALSERVKELETAAKKDMGTRLREKYKTKISEAMQGWAAAYSEKDPEGFEAWAKAAPDLTAAMGEVPIPASGSASDAPLSKEENAVASGLGIDPKKMREEV